MCFFVSRFRTSILALDFNLYSLSCICPSLTCLGFLPVKPFHKYPDILEDTEKFPRYLKNIKLFRKIRDVLKFS